jgi:hypothetical protein
MKKWKYLELFVNLEGLVTSIPEAYSELKGGEMEYALDMLGSEGWEVVTVLSDLGLLAAILGGGGGHHYLFKRPVEEDSA